MTEFLIGIIVSLLFTCYRLRIALKEYDHELESARYWMKLHGELAVLWQKRAERAGWVPPANKLEEYIDEEVEL